MGRAFWWREAESGRRLGAGESERAPREGGRPRWALQGAGSLRVDAPFCAGARMERERPTAPPLERESSSSSELERLIGMRIWRVAVPTVWNLSLIFASVI